MFELLFGLFATFACEQSTALIFQSSAIDEYGAVNFTMQVTLNFFSFQIKLSQTTGGQSECASLLARGDLELIETILQFNSSVEGGSGSSTSLASDLFIQVQSLNSSADIVSCFLFGGFDLEIPNCGIAGSWPVEWDSSSGGLYTATANVTKTKSSGEEWVVCVGNGRIDSPAAVYYSGQLIFSPTLTYAVPITASPTLLPSATPTEQAPPASSAPTLTPSLAPSSLPSLTMTPTSASLQILSSCNEPLLFSFSSTLSGGQSLCTNFGANGSLTSFTLSLLFSGSVSGEKASDFGIIFYSTHHHYGVQYGGYNYYLEGVEFISGWPSSWNSRSAGEYSVEQTVEIEPPFAVPGDYYRFCLFNGWSSAQEVTYTGTLNTSASVGKGIRSVEEKELETWTLNCDVIAPDLSPTLSPTPLPSVSLAPSQLTERGIFPSPSSQEPFAPLSFLFALNLTSAASLCSPLVEAMGNLTSLVTVFSFSTANDVSWASDLLVSVRLVSAVEECFTVGGEDVSSEETCLSPTEKYDWPATLRSSRDGVYNATIALTGGGKSYPLAYYEVHSSICLSPCSLDLLPSLRSVSRTGSLTMMAP
jgi:hypothetical protein